MTALPTIEAPPVASVEAWLLRIPLERPIRFPKGTWTTWNYVVVRVTGCDGREAGAYGFIGEIPLDLMVTELIAPRVVDAPPADLRVVAEQCAAAANPPLSDVLRPAASLVEVCLWDLAAQAADVPLWRLLSADPARHEVPVMAVEHRRDGDTPEAFARRVSELAADGFLAVKLKDYGDAADTAARLAAVRAAVGDELELVVDVGWAWPDVATAVREARLWQEHRLAWIEDPFPPHRIEDAVRLRQAIDAPLGIGDLVTSIDLAERLVDGQAVDVLRVDATTMGGFAGLEHLCRLADSAGVTVSPELNIELHRHAAFAWPAFRGVEVYSPASGVWSAGAFLRPAADAAEGATRLTAPEAPGSGLEVAWDAVQRLAMRASRYPPDWRA